MGRENPETYTFELRIAMLSNVVMVVVLLITAMID